MKQQQRKQYEEIRAQHEWLKSIGRLTDEHVIQRYGRTVRCPACHASFAEALEKSSLARSKGGGGGCPGSVNATHNDPNADGICNWCNQKIAPRKPRLAPPTGAVSEVVLAYDYYWSDDDPAERYRAAYE